MRVSHNTLCHHTVIKGRNCSKGKDTDRGMVEVGMEGEEIVKEEEDSEEEETAGKEKIRAIKEEFNRKITIRQISIRLDKGTMKLMMVDSDTRQIGKILRRYNEMIVRCLSACAVFDKDEQGAVLEVFDRRRTMFKSPTHVAVMMLDPEFRERTMPNDDEMQHGLKVALVQFRYPEGSAQHIEVLTAVDKFHAREPPFDDVAMDQTAQSYPHPASCWESKEKRFPHTTFLVGRILHGFAAALHPLTSAGGPSVSAAVTSDVRRPPVAAEQESMLPPHSSHGVQPDVRGEVVAMPQSDTYGPHACDTVSRPPPALVEWTAVAGPDGDLPEGEISHTAALEKSAAGHVGLACPTGSLSGIGELSTMDSTLVSLPDLPALISPGLPHVSPPNPHQPVATEWGPDAFDEFGGDTITVCPTVLATPTFFRVGRPYEVDLGIAEMATRHLRDGHRNIAQCSLSNSFDGAEDGGFAALAAVERAARPSRPPSNSEHQPISVIADAVAGIPATNTTDTTQQSVVGSVATTRRDRATVLPTVAFYTSGTTSGGLDEQGVRIVGKPSTPFMGTRSIGTVDDARHTAMTKYKARHGTALPTKTFDVQATRAAKASLSWARKKASTRKASRSSPHMRSHLTRSGPVHLKDGEIAPDGDALDVGGRAATTADGIDTEGAGDAVAGEKRCGSVLIVHDDSTDVAPGDTTGTDDAGDFDYVPKARVADEDDGGGQQVRRRTGLGPDGQRPQGTPSATIPAAIDR
ncbi:hypothetical protein CBR_g4246 [Chara braunii]|uniref:Uncharacterized protein n=1 Tax=Chara braunii TaxID=69332 RepID=A0A388JR81_CHABU|nr:hypothetical protein CBR_g4246 [Chara braunii]|eukprot:GBG60291.1 hypothetical protein CBR_g4246 [Chara braunii]